jgi:hypothetical protein
MPDRKRHGLDRVLERAAALDTLEQSIAAGAWGSWHSGVLTKHACVRYRTDIAFQKDQE